MKLSTKIGLIEEYVERCFLDNQPKDLGVTMETVIKSAKEGAAMYVEVDLPVEMFYNTRNYIRAVLVERYVGEIVAKLYTKCNIPTWSMDTITEVVNSMLPDYIEEPDYE